MSSPASAQTPQSIAPSLQLDNNRRAFGDAIDLEGGRLLVSARPPAYPYAPFIPANYVYALTASGWALSAVLERGPARTVQLSGNIAFVDAIRLRLGTTPTVFDLP